MKRKAFLSIVLLVFGLIFNSCSKEKDSFGNVEFNSDETKSIISDSLDFTATVDDYILSSFILSKIESSTKNFTIKHIYKEGAYELVISEDKDINPPPYQNKK